MGGNGIYDDGGDDGGVDGDDAGDGADGGDDDGDDGNDDSDDDGDDPQLPAVCWYCTDDLYARLAPTCPRPHTTFRSYRTMRVILIP